MSMKLENPLSSVNPYKLITLIILVALLFCPAIAKLVKMWGTNDDYSHGFFVIPISFYMVWQRREKLRNLNFQPSWMGLPVLIVGSVSYLIASITKFHSLTHLAMPIVILGLLLFFGGWRLVIELSLPLLFLFFMFPIPSSYYVQITNQLKLVVTKISEESINLMRIPVYREGNILFLASTQLEVTEACSGIRSMYSFLMLSCLFSLFSVRLSPKIVLIISAVPLAMAVNIIRIIVTAVLANFFGEEIAQGFFHQFSGMILFILGLCALFTEYRFLKSKTN